MKNGFVCKCSFVMQKGMILWNKTHRFIWRARFWHVFLRHDDGTLHFCFCGAYFTAALDWKYYSQCSDLHSSIADCPDVILREPTEKVSKDQSNFSSTTSRHVVSNLSFLTNQFCHEAFLRDLCWGPVGVWLGVTVTEFLR
jgi:hypothetical protein